MAANTCEKESVSMLYVIPLKFCCNFLRERADKSCQKLQTTTSSSSIPQLLQQVFRSLGTRQGALL